MTDQPLFSLLMSLFSDEEFKQWIRMGPEGEALAARLPGASAAKSVMIARGVEILTSSGHVGRGLFVRLSKEFPGRAADIRRAALSLGIRITPGKRPAADDADSDETTGTDDPRPGVIHVIACNTAFSLHERLEVAATATVAEIIRRLMLIIDKRYGRKSPIGFDFRLKILHENVLQSGNLRLCDVGVADGHALHVEVDVRPYARGESWEPRTLAFNDSALPEGVAERVMMQKVFEGLKTRR